MTDSIKISKIDYVFLTFGCLLFMAVFFGRLSVAPITDVLENKFNTNASGIGLLSSFFFIPYVIMQIPIGILLEFFSCELLLFLSSLLMSIGILIFGLSPNLLTAIISRFIFGFAASPVWITSITLISQRFGTKNVPKYTGIVQGAGSTFVIIGTLIQAQMYDKYEIWRQLYYVFAASTLIVGILLFSVVYYEQNSLENVQKIPKNNRVVSDSNLINPNVSSDEMELIEMESNNNNTTDNLDNEMQLNDIEKISNGKDSSIKRQSSISIRRRQGVNAKSSKGLKYENKSKLYKLKHNLYDIIQNYNNWILALLFFCTLNISLGLSGLWMVPYLVLKLNYSRSLSVFISGLQFASSAVGAVIFGNISTKYKQRKLIICVGIILILNVEWILLLNKKYLHISFVIICSIVFGLGSGILGIMFALVRELNWYYDASDTASAFLNTIGISAGFVTQFVIGELLDLHWQKRNNSEKDSENGTRIYTISDYNFAFILIHVALGICVISMLLVKETNGKNIIYKSRKKQNKNKNIQNITNKTDH